VTPARRDLLLVPLDDRPCCRHFPVRLAAMAGHDLTLPPRDLLGNYLDPGDPDRLLDWLEQRPLPPAGQILSLDMLCWGGLVASRRPDLARKPAVRRLERLCSLARTRPSWAFSTIMRTAPTQTSVEEVEQAARLTELALWMSRCGRDVPGALQRVEALRQAIPTAWVDRYLRARHRNHGLNLAALKAAGEGCFRHLLLGIDDSRTEGLNVLEAAHLEKALARLRAPATVAPGTDEMALLLVVRVLAPAVPVAVRWSQESDRARVTRYEDRSLEGVVEAQARAAGVELRARAPRQLWVYGPHGEQGEAAEQGRPRRSRRAAAFAEALSRELAGGARIAVADVARANGSDRALLRELLQAGLMPRLAGYAGWNTAGNTLGTALACAALAPEFPTPTTERERLSFLLERLGDDYLYQAELRQEVAAPLGGSFVKLAGPLLDQTRRRVQRQLGLRLRRLFHEYFAEKDPTAGALQLTEVAVDLPWPRTFEIEVRVRLKRGTL